MLCQAQHLEGPHIRSSPVQQRFASAQSSSHSFESARVAAHTRVPRNRRARDLATAQSFPAVFVSAAPAQTVDEQAAEDVDPGWQYGEAGLQGPRDSMEDFTSIIPSGRCGFFVACELLHRLSDLQNSAHQVSKRARKLMMFAVWWQRSLMATLGRTPRTGSAPGCTSCSRRQ